MDDLEFEARKPLYQRRISRFVVECPQEVCVKISYMENLENQSVLKKQPYFEILRHVIRQWMSFGSPIKAHQGMPKGSKERANWDVSIFNISHFLFCLFFLFLKLLRLNICSIFLFLKLFFYVISRR